VRSGKASAWMVGIIAAALMVVATPAIAQQTEEFPQPGFDTPLDGYTRGDGTVVLTDESFCRFLLGSLWGNDRLTFSDLIDKTKKQKKARAAAFEPASDEATLARCSDAVAAFRSDPPDDDTVAAWARRSPVVPEAFAGLLPDDFVARPLAQAAPVGDAARTSGFGSVVSAPFAVDGETWLAELDAVACEAWSGILRNARDADISFELTGNREYLYNIVPGHYYWEVAASDCDWSVDLASVELGADPDATPAPRLPVPKLFGDKWRPGASPNEDFLNATQARQAVLEAGFTVGECVEEAHERVFAGRVWGQDPAAGTLLEAGSPVDVFIVSDCDVVLGDRIVLE